MGVVYKAEDLKLKRLVALKFLPPVLTMDLEAKKRFINEAQAASSLQHNNICSIHEIDETDDGQMFICMDFYEGETLKKKIAQGPLSLEEALDIGAQLASGLAEAHEHGIVHRDVKPANILITKSGVAKILDFGVAKLIGGTKLTSDGTTLGTVAYMPPEQLQGGEVDARSDIFAVGIIMFEMLTQRLPFKGEHSAALMYSIINDDPLSLKELRRDAPEKLIEFCDRCLQKDANARPHTMSDALRILGIAENIKVIVVGHWHHWSWRMRAGVVASVIVALTISLWLAQLAISKGGDISKLLGINSLSVEKRIAVLPFNSIGNDSSNQVFCSGLVETLTSQLSEFEQFQGKLWVVPSSEVRRGNVATAEDAYRKFNVNLVLTGSVQKVTQGYRLTLNLIDAKDQRQLASRIIDDPMTSNSYLQDETIFKVSDLLNVELKPANLEYLTAGKTVSAKAYELYLKALGSYLDFDKKKNLDSAIGLFNQAINIDSSYALAYAGLGQAQLIKFQQTRDIRFIESAIENCDKAIKLNNRLTSVRTTLGHIYIETGKYNEAKDEFQKILEIYPAKSEAYVGRASAFLKMGMIPEAEASYKKAIEMKAGYWNVYNYLGWFYYQQGKYWDAAAQFQQVIRLTPSNSIGYLNLATMYYFLGQKDDAVKTWNKSLEIEPDYRAYSNLAVVYFGEKKYKEAARMYEKIVGMNKNDYRMWGYLAASYYWTPDEREKSLDANRRALSLAEQQFQINRKDPQIITSMASYYAMLGELNKSRTMLSNVKFLEITDPQTYVEVGVIYEEWFGEREAAINWITKALKKGYPVEEINKKQQLQNLVKDKRFISLISDLKKKSNSTKQENL